MHDRIPSLTRLAAGATILMIVAGCASSAGTPSPASTAAAGAAAAASSGGTPNPDASQAADTGIGAAAGDVPDNAVYLTYHSAASRFSIQYVEGWQVRTAQDGVTIRDKDSTELVRVVTLPTDVPKYVSGTDLPALQSQPGFRLVKQDTVKIGSVTCIHLLYHAMSEPNPVTGKQVPSTVDRFYVPGPALAIVTLATPEGVDNVDAFRRIVTSFTWS
jgi:hypothetical protein